MSVAQVKKRFGEMESYLGRDKEALRRLKLLKDDVNVLRTSLAAAEEKAEQAEIVKNAARDRADKAEVDTESLRLRNQQLEAQIDSLKSQLDSVSHRDETDDCDDQESPASESEIKAVIKRLRRTMKYCPRMSAPYSKTRPMIFKRESLAEGWSNTSLWQLGAAVAILASIDGSVTLETEELWRDVKLQGHADDSGMSRHVMQWFGAENITDGSSAKAGFARVINMKKDVVTETMTGEMLNLP